MLILAINRNVMILCSEICKFCAHDLQTFVVIASSSEKLLLLNQYGSEKLSDKYFKIVITISIQSCKHTGIVYFVPCSVKMHDVSLALLRIPSSRPNPRTFSQFVRVQILGFLAAKNDSFETYIRKFFSPHFSNYTTRTPSEWH